MIPKTCAYMWMIAMGLQLLFKNKNIIEAGHYNENGKICKAYDGTF